MIKMDLLSEQSIVFSSFDDIDAFNEKLTSEFERRLVKNNVLCGENELTVTSALIGFTLKEDWNPDYDIVPEVENPECENVSIDAFGNDLEESAMNELLEYHVMDLSGNCGILDVERRKSVGEEVSNNAFLQMSANPTSGLEKKLWENRNSCVAAVASGMCSMQQACTAPPINTQQVVQMCIDYAQECHQPSHQIGVWTESLHSGNLLCVQTQNNLDCGDVRNNYKTEEYASSLGPLTELNMDETIGQSDHVSWLDSCPEWEVERSQYEEWGGVLAAIVRSPRSSLDMVPCTKPHINITPPQDQQLLVPEHFIPKPNPVTTEIILEQKKISSGESDCWKESTGFHHAQTEGWDEWLTAIQTQTDNAWAPEPVWVRNTPSASRRLGNVREDQVVPQSEEVAALLRQEYGPESSHSVPLRLNQVLESSHSVPLRLNQGSESSHSVPLRQDHGSESFHSVPFRQDHGLESSHSVLLRQDHGSVSSRCLGLSDVRGPKSVDTNLPVNRKPRGLKRHSAFTATKLSKSDWKGSGRSSTYRPKLLLAFTTDSQKYSIDLTLGRPLGFKTIEEEEKWDLGVEVNGRRLRAEVESGEVVPEGVDRGRLERRLRGRELAASRAHHYDPLLPSTLRRLAIERALIDLDRTVKQYLLTDPQLVLLRLETALRLPITAQSLLRLPHLLATLTKVTKFCGVKNASITEKIRAILKIVNETQGDVDKLVPPEWKTSEALAEDSQSLFLTIFDSCRTEGNKEGAQVVRLFWVLPKEHLLLRGHSTTSPILHSSLVEEQLFV